MIKTKITNIEEKILHNDKNEIPVGDNLGDKRDTINPQFLTADEIRVSEKEKVNIEKAQDIIKNLKKILVNGFTTNNEIEYSELLKDLDKIIYENACKDINQKLQTEEFFEKIGITKVEYDKFINLHSEYVENANL